MSQLTVIASGLGMIALLFGALALMFYLLWWIVLIAVRFVPMIGKRHRHPDWQKLNRGASRIL